MLNLLRAVARHAQGLVTPVLFVGSRMGAEETSPFAGIGETELVRSDVFEESMGIRRMLSTLARGSDSKAERTFADNRIDVVFESAGFYGRRLSLPAIAWIPDFQHRHLPEMFSFGGYWKREIGFRAQVAARRVIMLSSEDARRDCERFYPRSRGHTQVVRFAVAWDGEALSLDPRAVAADYGLPARFFYLPNQFWKHKNHRVVIEALHILKNRGHDVLVAASGSTTDTRHPGHFEELRELSVRYGAEDSFRILGMIPRHHLVALMRVCTAVINPSLFEGWSTTVEEAKSLGTPLILSDLAVHREQAESDAFFFPADSAPSLADALEAFQEVPTDARTSRERLALERANSRTESFVRDFIRILEQALHAAGVLHIESRNTG